MKKQVIFIHGGEAFSDYSAFIEYLKSDNIDPYEKPSKRWHQRLQEDLGDEYEVFLPHMPNSQNAKYLEWKIWFEKYIPFLHDDVILIGHSQGGYFLVKYLLENGFPIRIKGLYLVAAPFEPDDFGGEDGGDFNFNTAQVPALEDVSERIVLFHSKDDFVVPFDHALRYKNALPKAELFLLEDRIHFWQEAFPELIEDIKAQK
jgi:predicted alpha/beta hydrolase family esterase